MKSGISWEENLSLNVDGEKDFASFAEVRCGIEQTED